MSVGAVLAGGVRAWFRGLPVAFMVVVLSGVLPVLLAMQMYDPFVSDSETPINSAVTAYTNTTLTTWVTAVLLFEPIRFHTDGILAGAFALASCYAATGILACLFYTRATAGQWLGTSFLAVGRLVAFAILAGGVLVIGKALLAKAFVFDETAITLWPILLLVVTILEGWLVCPFWLVLPILAIERVPLGTALLRSRKLTRGSGFRLFGLIALLAALTYVCLTVLGMTRFAHRLSYAWSFGLAGLFLTTLQAAMLAEGYRQLREIHEGPDERTVAAVFE